jgi:hypothetical protein
MKYQPMLAAVALALGGAGALAAELPTWQVDGFVMTPLQQSVLTPSNARERLPAFAFVYGSPHQIMVLTPRRDSLTAERWASSPQSSEDLLIKVSH